MVRQKQTFPSEATSSNTASSSANNLENVGFEAPQKKSGLLFEGVQSSPNQKRFDSNQSLEYYNESETIDKRKAPNKRKSINLEEIINLDNEDFLNIEYDKMAKVTENQTTNAAIRKAYQRSQMSLEQIQLEREKDRLRKASNRSQMNDEERELEKERNCNSHKNRRQNERNASGKFYTAAASHKNGQFYQLSSFDFNCKHCGALHFFEERSDKSNANEIVFSNCCKKGKIALLNERIPEYPEELKALFYVNNPNHKNFITNIRRYNSAFACASISCFKFKFPTPGPPCYKIQGQIYHKFNPNAMPPNNHEIPTNGQLYFIDSEEAINIRCEINKECDPHMMAYLDKFIRENNKFAQSYKLMKEVYEQEEECSRIRGYEMPKIRLLFNIHDQYDQRRYNIPQTNEVCGIIVCNADDDVPPARIIVYPRGKKELIDIYPLDKCVNPMSYPLLYPTAIEDYHIGLKNISGKKITLCDYTKFHLFFRENKFVPHFYASKLFQQWVVDQAARIEWDRLEYVRTHQTEICSSNYSNVENFLKKKAESTCAEIQKKVILPSSFTGGPRNMHEHFMDAMAIVNETGKPDLFITFTCNPNDPDILKCLKPGQIPSDRPDIIARVFHLKKAMLLDLIFEKKIFGEIIGNCWVIEYQKRGLPHLHLLITLHSKDKWHTTIDIDNFISAEIPDPVEEPDLYEIITNCMMHEPCNEKSLCWDKLKKKCKKKFPKPFRDETELSEDGYPHYKRPNNGRSVYRKGKELTNQYVVPYNPFLSITFNAHINVERVADIDVVKYLYDYIYKGYDAATIECVQIGEDGTKKVLKYDEVGKYLEARYLSPCEACWRIFKFPMQGKSHSVDQLEVHLENMQRVFYKKNATNEEIEEASIKDSTLTAYFKFCQENPNIEIKYTDMPKYCTWLKKERKWKYPRQDSQKKIGRMVPVNPTETERYYLRYLLLNINICGKSLKDLRTVNGIEYDTFAKACLARGLARDDDEWHKAMEEATFFSRKYPRGLRILFANILVHCGPKYPEKLWDTFKDHMVGDLKRRFPNLPMGMIYEKGLNLIDQCLKYREKSLSEFKNMPQIKINNYVDEDELYDPKDELDTANRLITMMNNEQLRIIEYLKDIIESSDRQKCLFIDGPGGTGKSFTLKTIYHLARANNKRVCNMAFSGIAATILKKGRTLHNRFKLPLNIKRNSVSGIESHGKDADEIKATDIFIWDEAPMASRYVLDIIDQKLRELTGNNKPFGGKTLILSGDFRQCLPIKEFANRSEIVDLLIKKSSLWTNFETLKLTINMRANPNEREFAKELIDIGNGVAGENGYISVPDECICEGNLVDEIFGDILNGNNFDEICDRAILSPYNSVVDHYNNEVMSRFPGDYHIYLSIDESDTNKDFQLLQKF